MSKTTINYELDPESFGGEDYPSNPIDGIHPLGPDKPSFSSLKNAATGVTGPQVYQFEPIASPEEIETIRQFYAKHPHMKSDFDSNEPWIQTFSGQRFQPLNPMSSTINIIDIAHSLSQQCRFTGHTKEFYSVAQHCVLVSYLCDYADRLHGLLHDASEYVICDFSSPLKKSGKFNYYIEVEKKIQDAIYDKFGLTTQEPKSVKMADMILLATEARDLLPVKRDDWKLTVSPAPFTIVPLPPVEAEKLYLDRFYELYL